MIVLEGIAVIITIYCLAMFIVGMPVAIIVKIATKDRINYPMWVLIPAAMGVVITMAIGMTSIEHWYDAPLCIIGAAIWGYWALDEYSHRGRLKDIARINQKWQCIRELIVVHPDIVDTVNKSINQSEIKELEDLQKYW